MTLDEIKKEVDKGLFECSDNKSQFHVNGNVVAALIDLLDECKSFVKPDKCSACGGHGELDDASPYDMGYFNKWKCSDCNGSGVIDNKTLAKLESREPLEVDDDS